MKVTELWLYPIKGIRGIPITEAQLGPQGLKHDRVFMLYRVGKNGALEKIQLSRYPECSLFEQELVHNGEGTIIRVRYHAPQEPIVTPETPEMNKLLEVPLEPELGDLETMDVDLHNSMVSAYRMGSHYDAWFSACFGFQTMLFYIGDGRRPVLGSFSPKTQQQASQQGGWLSSITNMVTGGGKEEPDWLTFTDCAPFLVATEASLADVNARLDHPIPMVKFRPNIVVDGDKAWDEDFWAELSLPGPGNGDLKMALTKLCNRCTSVNVDYATGRPAEGDQGAVLKKLMADRRVDTGMKWSPSFGRYGFLTGKKENGEDVTSIRIGDEINVIKRFQERPVWDWPMKSGPGHARFYGQT